MKTLNSVNKKVLTLIGMVALTALSISVVRAEGSSTKISGFVDTTYNYNLDKPTDRINRFRSFDYKANNFAMNSAQINFMGTMGDAGYVVKVIGGSDAELLRSTGSSSVQDALFQEAYMTYACPITGINVKAGKFATLEGIEVIESKDDPTISRGYLFGLAEPFTHTGVLLSRTFGKVELGAGLVNGWDNTSDQNKGKTAIGKIGLNFGDPLSLVISGTHGAEQADSELNRNSIDAVLTTKIIPKVTLYVQGNYGDEKFVGATPDDRQLDKWSGAGIQPVVAITNKFSVGSRLEYFTNEKGSRLNLLDLTKNSQYALTNFTITPAYKMTDNFTVRLEYRYDTANKDLFIDDKGAATSKNTTVSAQWLVTF